jgi:hypothetical protein
LSIVVTVVLQQRHAREVVDGLVDLGALARVGERDPVRLPHVRGRDQRLGPGERGLVDVAVLPEAVVGLLLRLPVVVGDQTAGAQAAERLLDVVLLLVGHRALAARPLRVGGAAVAEVEGDLQLAAEPVLGQVGLLVQEDADPDQGQGHDEGEYDRDVHRQVAAQSLAELGENIGQLHRGRETL